jgi:uncharacterized protein YndB with AHSA1/START domain
MDKQSLRTKVLKNPITVETIVKASIEKVWEYWNEPEHIMKWAFASSDWEAQEAENDLKVGGKFRTKMAAKDGSASFDFNGVYTEVEEHQLIEYDMEKAESEAKSRHVKVEFKETPEGIKIIETFDPENENPEEMQRGGWQAILDNFKKYTE